MINSHLNLLLASIDTGFHIHVEHGTVHLADTEASDTVTLTTPVPENKSFVIVSARSTQITNPKAHSIFVKAILQTVVNGNYTELHISRSGDQDDLYIQYQVVYSEDITVQGVDCGSSGTNFDYADITISEVNLSQTWVVGTYQGNNDDSWSTVIGFELTSTTNLRVHRGIPSDDDILAYAYVISSPKFTVDTYSFNVTGNSYDQTITAKDDNAFAYFTYVNDNYSKSPKDVCYEGQFTSSTNFLCERYTSDDNSDIFLQVIHIKGMKIESDQVTIASSDSQETVSKTLDTSQSLLITNEMGNAKCYDTLNTDGLITHKVTSTQLIFDRIGNTEAAELTYFLLTPE